MSLFGVMLPVASVLFMLCGCCGIGIGCLAALGLIRRMARLEVLALGFALGFGIMGWLMFFPGLTGLLGLPASIAVLVCGLPGLTFLTRARAGEGAAKIGEAVDGRIWFLLWIAFAVLVIFDCAEAFSPPADADTLAYHFALAKQFFSSGRIEFTPRVADGAIPLLIQMNYLVAYSLGGEGAMTLFAGVSSWMAGLLTFVAARDFMNRAWAFAIALLFMSTPTMLYAGGSGQIEPKISLFVLVATIAVVRAISTRDLGYVGLAGIAVGLVVGSKYTGLLFGVAATLPLLVLWRSPKAIVLYAGLAVVAGLQWYVWLWWHTGDPVYPVLYEVLGLPDSAVWTAAQDEVFRAMHGVAERPLPRTFLWLFIYPFHAALFPIGAIESGRTGFGPYAFALLPFFLFGLWRFRRRILSHPLSLIALIAVGYYVFWFATGVSQRLRHLLPIWPLVLIFVTAVAARYSDNARLRRIVPIAAGVTLVLQLCGQVVFGLSYARHILSGEGREAFLQRTVSQYDFIKPTEQFMGADDRVLIDQRQLVYLFSKRIFYFHYAGQSQVVARNVANEPARFLAELRALNITHLLVPLPVGTNAEPSDLATAADALVAVGCAVPIQSMVAQTFGSRTLASGSATPVKGTLYKLTADGCHA